MKYGVIAERLGHSFSKEIHNQLFDYEYELKEIAPTELDSFMRAKDFCAINVTIPYKQAVIPYLDEISDTARTIGAVNTIVNKNGRLYGYNTDYQGMMALLERAGISVAGKHVLILGSGGTSKTANAVVRALGCATVTTVSRIATAHTIDYAEALTYSDTQIIINTTPCGMFPQLGESAIDIRNFPRLEGVVDAVYNPLRSQLVCDALAQGIPATGGLYMLVAQAAFAAELFVDQTVSADVIDRVFGNLYHAKQNVVLVGMPSCGKTTVGRLLAQRLGKTFLDTDDEIVKREGRTIPAIFEDGEPAFRHIESTVIRTLCANQGAVIATGGGAVLRQENVALLKENGRLFFLDRPLEQLVATANRPLSSDRAALERRYHERYTLYRDCCDHHITQTATPEQAAAAIEEAFYEDIGT